MTDKTLKLSEQVNQILEGTEVSDEFKSDLSTIIEATVADKLSVLSEELVAENAIKLASDRDEMVATLTEANATYEQTLEENVSNYLDFVVEEWASDNELAIEAGIKVERAENFMEGLQHLFSENFVEIPESGEDVIAISESKIADMESKIDTQLTKIAELQEGNIALIKDGVILDLSEGLTAIEKDKLSTLSEDVDFSTKESYAKKVKVIRESFFKQDVVVTDKHLNEDVITPNLMEAIIPSKPSNAMDKYLKVLNK